MDLMRRQLEELMESVTTDEGGGGGSGSSSKHFTNPDVCKHYLGGLCPHDLFENTKFYLGECGRIHSDELRQKYLEARETRRYYYEEETVRILQQIVDDCDKKIARGMQRCEEDGDADGSKPEGEEENPVVSAEVKKLDDEISEKMQQVEELGEAGDVDASMEVMEKISQLKRQKEQHLTQSAVRVTGTNPFHSQKLKPCNICGALLSVTDSDRRLSEHFSGKIHLGFQEIRKHLDALKEYVKREITPPTDTNAKSGASDAHGSGITNGGRGQHHPRREPREKMSEMNDFNRGMRRRREGGGRRSGSRERFYDKGYRSPDRFRGKSWERGRGRSAEKYRHRSRDRHLEWGWERSRNRSYERGKGRRSRSKDRGSRVRKRSRDEESRSNRDSRTHSYSPDAKRKRSRESTSRSREQHEKRSRHHHHHHSDKKAESGRRSGSREEKRYPRKSPHGGSRHSSGERRDKRCRSESESESSPDKRN